MNYSKQKFSTLLDIGNGIKNERKRDQRGARVKKGINQLIDQCVFRNIKMIIIVVYIVKSQVMLDLKHQIN